MTLKDCIARDVQDLFFRHTDFAETHEVEGTEIDAMIDNDQLAKKKAELGIAEGDILLYARTADLPPRKEPGSYINLDGREHILVEWTDNMGISSLVLNQNRSY